MSEESPEIRVGVVIDLPQALAAPINRIRREHDWVSPGAIPEHITLVPPVVVRPHDRVDVRSHLTRVARQVSPFDIALQGTDTFRPDSPVVFLRVASGAHECAALHDAVHQSPLDHELQYRYHPHVTVAHLLEPSRAPELDVAMRVFADTAVAFTVTEFVLYQRPPGLGWSIDERFPLGELQTARS